MVRPNEEKKSFKYRRICKLPTCRESFDTNREWKFFHHPDCQKKWQIYLRRAQEELIIELMLCKERVVTLELELGMKQRDQKGGDLNGE